jgi:hypothetical protein
LVIDGSLMLSAFPPSTERMTAFSFSFMHVLVASTVLPMRVASDIAHSTDAVMRRDDTLPSDTTCTERTPAFQKLGHS